MGVTKSKENSSLFEVQISVNTWQRDSHGLYDYEGREQDRTQIKGTGSFSLVRNEGGLHTLNDYSFVFDLEGS